MKISDANLDSWWPAWRDELGACGAPAAALDRIRSYTIDVLRVNRVENLISRRDPRAQVRSLVLEAASVSQWLYMQPIEDGPWMDLGTGGGFPGLVFACLDPDQEILLLDRRQGRCDFLRREARALGLPGVRVIEGDAERLAEGELAHRCALVSLKAVAEPDRALGLGSPFLRPGGQLLLFQRPGWRPDPASKWRIVDEWTADAPPFADQPLAAFLISN